MIDCIDEAWHEEGFWVEAYVAENRCWDSETLNQLWKEYSICYDGKSIAPIMVLDNSLRPSIVIGTEDDGAIRFEKTEFGKYRNSFSSVWIDSIINQLQEVKKRICE